MNEFKEGQKVWINDHMTGVVVKDCNNGYYEVLIDHADDDPITVPVGHMDLYDMESEQ